MPQPLLSIVIANYNYGRFLEEAVRSVIDQDGFAQCELIVVDGGSTDGSVEIVKKFADKLAWWVSEPDKGQSDAFNKGFAHAHGKYLTWLNADDLLMPDCLGRICRELVAHSDCEWFTGNFIRFENKCKKITDIGWGPHYLPKFLQTRNAPIVTYGPSTFFSRKIFDQFGPFDVRLHYSMDTDMWRKFVFGGVKKRRINAFCWAFRMHEASKTAEWTADKDAQGDIDIAIQRENCPYCMSKLLWYVLNMWRIFDGSLVMNGIYRIKLIGRVMEIK